MNGPNDLDDGWAELARELGLEGDRPFPAPVPDHAAADLHPPEDPIPDGDDEFVELPGDAPTDADVYAESDSDSDSESDDSEADGDTDDGEGEDSDGDGEGETSGEPGEPKKKRRRRRRRKKKPGEVATVPPAEGESTDESDEATESNEPGETATEDTSIEEEGASPAATRELIANWDVPSWETIVNTMLFRPQGRS